MIKAAEVKARVQIGQLVEICTCSEQSVGQQLALTGKFEAESKEIPLRHHALPQEPLASPGLGDGLKRAHTCRV